MSKVIGLIRGMSLDAQMQAEHVPAGVGLCLVKAGEVLYVLGEEAGGVSARLMLIKFCREIGICGKLQSLRALKSHLRLGVRLGGAHVYLYNILNDRLQVLLERLGIVFVKVRPVLPVGAVFD